MNDKQREELQVEIKKSVDKINASLDRSNKRWEQHAKDREEIYNKLDEITHRFVGKVQDFHALTKKGVKE